MNRFVLLIPTLALTVASCEELASPIDRSQELPSTQLLIPPRGSAVGAMECVASLSAIACGKPSSSVRGALLMVQNKVIRVESGPPTYSAATQTYSFDVWVANVSRAAIGTADGENADPQGTSVVLIDGPRAVQGTGAITLAEPHLLGRFNWSPNPLYYSRLPGLVRVGQKTGSVRWTFRMPPTIERFVFHLAVVTSVEPVVRISEVGAGIWGPIGITNGAFFEVVNIGEAPIYGVTIEVVDRVFTPRGARDAWASMLVADEWQPGERRLFAALDQYPILPVTPRGGFGSFYGPDPGYSHQFFIRSKHASLVYDTVTVPAWSFPVDGHSRERFGEFSRARTDMSDPNTWRTATTPVMTTCYGRSGCPSLWGSPGR